MIDVCDFIQQNVMFYDGDEGFLVGFSECMKVVWEKLQFFFKEEICKGVFDVDVKIFFLMIVYKLGYIDCDNELIVGFQIDVLFCCVIMLYGGLWMVEFGLKVAGFELDFIVYDIFIKYCKIYNEGVFDVYILEIMVCWCNSIIMGLLDVYGCGWIIGDYCCVVLYGIDKLLVVKCVEWVLFDVKWFMDDVICECEELVEQVWVFIDLVIMVKGYGCDIMWFVVDVCEVV